MRSVERDSANDEKNDCGNDGVDDGVNDGANDGVNTSHLRKRKQSLTHESQANSRAGQ